MKWNYTKEYLRKGSCIIFIIARFLGMLNSHPREESFDLFTMASKLGRAFENMI